MPSATRDSLCSILRISVPEQHVFAWRNLGPVVYQVSSPRRIERLHHRSVNPIIHEWMALWKAFPTSLRTGQECRDTEYEERSSDGVMMTEVMV
jgi:hypothetical protein